MSFGAGSMVMRLTGAADDEAAQLRRLEARVAELEAALADQRRRFEIAGDALVVHDDAGRFLEANAEACRLLGRSREVLLHMSLADVEPDFDLFGIQQAWRAMKVGQSVTVAGRPLAPGGRAVPVEVRLTRIDDDVETGERRFLAILRETGHRDRMGAQREAYQRRFRQLVEHAAGAFVLHDAAGRILDVNQRTCALLGQQRPAVLGRNLVTIDRRAATIDLEAHWRAMRVDVPELHETAYRRPDGDEVAVDVSVAAVDWEGERLFISFAYDVRERRAREAEHARFVADLSRSNRDLERFAWIASHDLQEPLRKIQLFADLLREELGEAEDGESEAASFLDVIGDAAVRMRGLVADLLDYSRVRTQPLRADQVDLRALIDGVLDDLQVAVAEAGATVELGLLPVVLGDATQLRMLFQNLLSNAIKYRHPDRAPTIEVRGRVERSLAIVEVSDDGIGFDAAHAEHIFEPFRRLHGRRDYPGTGVGLAICREVAERHRGSLSARGRPGEGATFTVRLPVRPPRLPRSLTGPLP
jgi:PAS domain S-box-containing protein